MPKGISKLLCSNRAFHFLLSHSPKCASPRPPYFLSRRYHPVSGSGQRQRTHVWLFSSFHLPPPCPPTFSPSGNPSAFTSKISHSYLSNWFLSCPLKYSPTYLKKTNPILQWLFTPFLNQIHAYLLPHEALLGWLLAPSLTSSGPASPLSPACQVLELAKLVLASGSWHFLLLLPEMLCPRSLQG